MYATNVRALGNDPTAALREAQRAPVLVLEGDVPNAVILHLESTVEDAEDARALLRPALAAALFRERVLSLGAAAKVGGLGLSEFIDHLAALDVDVVTPDEDTTNEAATLAPWARSS